MSGKEGVQVIVGSVNAPQGFTAGGLACGLKKEKLDLGWIFLSGSGQCAAVYTPICFKQLRFK